MNKPIWMLPEGIDELLPPQAWALECLRRKILDHYWRCGYDLVHPPQIEYIESLLIGTGRKSVAPVLAVKVVDDMDAAIAHLRRYGSQHTEIIVTNDYANAEAWQRRVNSSTVGVNCSTAFADGFRLGLGAEIGISTSKLHAFGPMGLEELTTRKFVLSGDGQLRE